jgi:hypothetical protein
MICLGNRNLGTDIAQSGVYLNGKGYKLSFKGFVKGLPTIIALLKNPASKGDIADIKESLEEISRQLLEIKNMLTEIMNMISETQIQSAFQEDERVISDSLLYYNRMMNMTTKAAHHQARQSFIANGNKVFESVKHLLRGLLGEGVLTVDLLERIVQKKQV